MSKEVKALLLKIIKESIFFTLVLFGLHKYIQYHFFRNIVLFHPIYVIYIFLLLSLIVLFYYIIKAFDLNPDKIFTTFAVGSFAKSAGVILFFLPLFFKESENLNNTVFNFFIPYFLFVFFEIYQITKLSKELK